MPFDGAQGLRYASTRCELPFDRLRVYATLRRDAGYGIRDAGDFGDPFDIAQGMPSIRDAGLPVR